MIYGGREEWKYENCIGDTTTQKSEKKSVDNQLKKFLGKYLNVVYLSVVCNPFRKFQIAQLTMKKIIILLIGHN